MFSKFSSFQKHSWFPAFVLTFRHFLNYHYSQVVLTEDARRFSDQMGIQLFETSAKDNINVEEMFRAITELVLKHKKVRKYH